MSSSIIPVLQRRMCNKTLDWLLFAAAVVLFANVVYIVYKPVAWHHTVNWRLQGSFKEGNQSFRCKRHFSDQSRLVESNDTTTTVQNVRPRYRTTLTRLGTEIDFDQTLCPPESLWAKHQLTNASPLHLDCPTLFLVGARKGGTTSLYQYLSRHPDFKGVRLDKGPRAGETFHFSSRYGTESWETYLKKFPSDGSMIGDASVGNLVRCEVPQRLFESCGKLAKVVMLLRDPIDRFVSNFVMRARNNAAQLHQASTLRTTVKVQSENFFSELKNKGIRTTGLSPDHWAKLLCLFGPSANLVFEGLYLVHLNNWLCNFPPGNILVINSEEFYSNTTLILSQVLKFLGLKVLDEESMQWITSFVYNKGNYTVPSYQRPTDKDRKILQGIYQPYNDALMRMLHWDKNRVKW